MDKKVFYIKLFSSIVISFLLSWFLSHEFFLAQSPILRPNLDKYLAVQFSGAVKSTTRPFTNLFSSAAVTTGTVDQTVSVTLEKIPENQIGKGIYSKEDGNISYVLIKEDEVEWKVYSFEIDGKTKTIKVANDESPPSKGMVGKMY